MKRCQLPLFIVASIKIEDLLKAIATISLFVVRKTTKWMCVDLSNHQFVRVEILVRHVSINPPIRNITVQQTIRSRLNNQLCSRLWPHNKVNMKFRVPSMNILLINKQWASIHGAEITLSHAIFIAIQGLNTHR